MRLPRHIGIIPDGNRRWAVREGMDKADGYDHASLREWSWFRMCRELGVEESGIDWMTDNCINVFAGSMRNHTKALTRDEVKQIYLEAF